MLGTCSGFHDTLLYIVLHIVSVRSILLSLSVLHSYYQSSFTHYLDTSWLSRSEKESIDSIHQMIKGGDIKHP
jgi:hypothetical protein